LVISVAALRYKEFSMNAALHESTFCAGFFSDVGAADRAIAELRDAGFSHQELAVICPERFKEHFSPEIWRAEPPTSKAPVSIAGGSALGAALGGVALAVSALATGGATLLPGAMVLIGGGALAGGLSSLIVSDGYDQGIKEYYLAAVHQGKIVVGLHLTGTDAPERVKKAMSLLTAAGATSIVPDAASRPPAGGTPFAAEHSALER
jgi:hypothetical protein